MDASATAGDTSTRPLSGDPALRALAGVAAIVAVVFGLGLLRPVPCVIVFWVLLGAGCLMFGHRSLLVARLPELSPAHRRFWRTMAFAGFCYAAGATTQAPMLIADPLSFDSIFSGPVHAAALGVGTIAIVVSMLVMPLGIDSRREKVRFWLDLGTIMAASATVGAYLNRLPETGQGAAQDLLRTAAHVLIGPAAFQVGLFAVVKLHLGGQAPFTRASAAALGAAAAITGTTQAVRTELAEHGHLHWHFGATLLAVVLLIACARIHQLEVRAHRPTQRARPRPFSVLPYVAMGATNVLLVVVLVTDGTGARAWIVVVGSIGCVGLVVARQLAAFHENSRLLVELDQKVRELNSVLAERNRLSAQLEHQAFHDALTGLANRTLFAQLLEASVSRPSGSVVAVVLVDLDDFKPVNDRFGHATGDALLTLVTARLTACVRDADVVARLGGDEFAVLCERLPSESVIAVADRIVRAMADPFRVGGIDVSIGASVGVAVAWAGCMSPSDILNSADAAMYAAKRRGKGRFAVAELPPTGT